MKIKLELNGVKNKLEKIANDDRVGLFLATTCARYMDEYVPMRTGALKDSARVNVPFKVYYETDYAKKVYYGVGITIHGDKHPNATSLWDQVMFESHKDQIAKETTKYISKL